MSTTTDPRSGLTPLSPRPDRAWLEGVYAAHATAVHALAVRTACVRLAPDITQEVFLSLWRSPGRFDPARGSMRTFLLTVTHNLAVDHLRSEAARRAREERTASEEPLPRWLEPESQLLTADTADRVAVAVSCLSPEIREAIETTFYGGLTYQQASQVLGQPEGTIKSRIRRGLSLLRLELERTS